MCVICAEKTVGVCTWSVDGSTYLMSVCVYVYCFGESMGHVSENCVYMHW